MQTPYNGWQNLQTLQSKEILSELMEAKKNICAKLLISDTGLGKTNTIKQFKRSMPDHTYVVTVGDSFRMIDVVDEILIQLGVEIPRHKWEYMLRVKLSLIAKHMEQLNSNKNKPLIIIDEAENMKPAALKMMKELYDAITENDNCSVVLIGTDQILDSILNRKNKNRQSVPQLWRRFKAGTRYIQPINKARDFKPFFEKYIPGNTDVQDILLELCENYGELHDYLHPVLLDCSQKGKPLTKETFEFYHKIPVNKTLKRA